MITVSSSSSELPVLGRRGLPLSGNNAGVAPRAWFASFALTTTRAPSRPDELPRPGQNPLDPPPSEIEADMEALPRQEDPQRRGNWASGGDSIAAPVSAPAAAIANAIAGKERTGGVSEWAQRREPSLPFETGTGDELTQASSQQDVRRARHPAQGAEPRMAGQKFESVSGDLPGAGGSPAPRLQADSLPRVTTASGVTEKSVPSPIAMPGRQTAALYEGRAGERQASRVSMGGASGHEHALRSDTSLQTDAPTHTDAPTLRSRSHFGAERPTSDAGESLNSDALRVASSPSSNRQNISETVVSAQGHGTTVRATAAQRESAAPAGFATTGFATTMGAMRSASARAEIGGAVPSLTDVAQLLERSRSLLAMGTRSGATHRIGTVQVVVKNDAPTHPPALPAAAISDTSRVQVASGSASRGYRNPWASYVRRFD